MNTKCGYCGKNSDCIPFDGGYCEEDTQIPTHVELVIMEVGKVVNPDFWPARYFVRYAHNLGETIGLYDRLGKLMYTTGWLVKVPEVIIEEQMKLTVNEVEALFEPKEMTQWLKLPMAA